MTRCSSPPESWCGKLPRRSSARGKRASRSSSSERARTSARESPGLWTASVSSSAPPIEAIGSNERPGSWKMMLTAPPR